MKRQQRLIALFETVRDIPYGYIGTRDPLQVLKKSKGTCSGKHLLLGYLFQTMGIEVKYMMCLTKLNFLKEILPDELYAILQDKEVYDCHNFLRVHINKWLDVDVTFDAPLERYGFPVNRDWNGTSDCEIAFKPIKIFEVTDLLKEKKHALDKFPEEMQKARLMFIKRLSNWLDEIRRAKLPV